MTSLHLKKSDIPDLSGKIAIVSGGASGIGFAAAKILSSKGAKVFILDLSPPDEPLPTNTEYVKCDITSWSDLLNAFKLAGNIDIAIANAGVSETTNFLEDTFDSEGLLVEPKYAVLDVNLRGVLNFVKLGLSQMRRVKTKGSIVITSSATAYAPEQSLPIYSSGKLALIGLVRALRSTLRDEDITINAVAPAATITKLLPAELAAPIMAAGLPVSTADHVGLALVYSATARESNRAEAYGKDTEEVVSKEGRWSGRTILTLGDTWTELEEPIARLRGEWFGGENTRFTRLQQSATDFRA